MGSDMRRPRMLSPATVGDEEAIRAVQELRDKMAAEILAKQQQLEGIDLALKILKEPPF